MAVGKIEYKKILKDENLTPKKLKDLYVSLRNDDSFGEYNKDSATDPTERYTIMTPEAATALIASRQQNTPSNTDTDIDADIDTSTDVSSETQETSRPHFEAILGGTWMPITLDSTKAETTGNVSTSARYTPQFSEKGQSGSNAEDVWNSTFQQYASQFGLKDEEAYMYLLGQLKHESGDFKYMEEIASGDAYEGRSDLGNTQRGDGRRYKGRGPIQVTGRNNYKQIYENFFVPNGLGQYNIVKNPELGSDPRIGSLMSIGWLLTTENGKRAIEAANNHDIRSLTKAINGGSNGLASRTAITQRLLDNMA